MWFRILFFITTNYFPETHLIRSWLQFVNDKWIDSVRKYAKTTRKKILACHCWWFVFFFLSHLIRIKKIQNKKSNIQHFTILIWHEFLCLQNEEIFYQVICHSKFVIILLVNGPINVAVASFQMIRKTKAQPNVEWCDNNM